jgi:hypothetical protein
MNHHDAEIADVVIVLNDQGQDSIDQAIGRCKACGLEVVDTNPDEGVIEGSIDAGKVHDLKSVPGVSYVRSVFTYTADYPEGDPRDQDGCGEGQCERDD